MINQKFRKCTEIEFEISNNFASNIFALMHNRKINRHDLCDALNINYNSFNRIMISQQRVPVSLLSSLRHSRCSPRISSGTGSWVWTMWVM